MLEQSSFIAFCIHVYVLLYFKDKQERGADQGWSLSSRTRKNQLLEEFGSGPPIWSLLVLRVISTSVKVFYYWSFEVVKVCGLG